MKTRILLAAALAFSVETSHANPVYEVTAESTHACGMYPEDGCKDFPKGFRFEASNWQRGAKTVGGKPVATEGQTGFPTYYQFDGHDVAPVLDAQGNTTEPTCQWPTGGVMQHAVTDAQGRVYIKRVEVVTKCVNGKMTTIQRALN
ncbi:hypothetical protein [Caballeronia sp. AZ10_KS36]|uniref:hypothetical protein n=1 Tax=Caballeronia sp. AZ10_KS36 TaxID=2921757 RepID=UPI002028A25D|nr:hypothetical protein [Caballeronia sp. AZ10_KS36]